MRRSENRPGGSPNLASCASVKSVVVVHRRAFGAAFFAKAPMRMRAILIVSLFLATLTSSSLAQGPSASAPPAPTSPPTVPTAWACTQKTLVDDVPCTVEGKSAPQAPSKDAGKEQQRQAKLLADDACKAIARSGEPDEDRGLMNVCSARMTVAVKKCGGDGARRLLDDEGRFNPGHTRCYGALAAVVRDMTSLAESSSTCCDCIADRCGGDAEKCVERMGANAKPDTSAQCLTSTCSAECAVLQLTTRKP